jgi:hypothetical protein
LGHGRELTTSVLWLIERGIGIHCVRLQPYDLGGRVLVDVQQIIPLPEMAEYQVRVTEKKRKEREARSDTRDRTNYDVTLGGHRFPGLAKRNAIYKTFRHLVEGGNAPEDIAEHCGPQAKRALMSVDGEVSAEDFVRRAAKVRAEEGGNFDPTRYFCREGQLFKVDGRTHAFLNQWGGKSWLDAMTNLRDVYPGHGIVFEPAE